jgi:hypothetical protein
VAITTEKNIFLVNFTCGILNENVNKAFINVDGVINIKDNGGLSLMEIPFSIPAVLPLTTANVDERIELSEDAVMPVLNLLDIDKEIIKSGENKGKKYIDEKNIEFKSLNFENKDITELLRGKI